MSPDLLDLRAWTSTTTLGGHPRLVTNGEREGPGCPRDPLYHSQIGRTLVPRAHADSAVHAALPSNTLAVYGNAQTKELTELVPGILNQLGPDSLANLRRLAESYQNMTARQAAAAAAAGGAGAGVGETGEKKEGEVDDDDEIPDLVENFDEADKKADGKTAADLEELE